LIESGGESQISLTDPDSSLLKQNEGFCMGYNVQTAVDAESHMIASFRVVNNPTVHGLITAIASEMKKCYGADTIEITVDNGYECPEDDAEALASGIVPNVIQRDGGCMEEVIFDYRDAPITDEQKASSRPEDIRACLEAGVIPDAYKGILTDAEIIEVKKRMHSTAGSAVLNMSSDEMKARVLAGFFIRDATRNLVYCLHGEI
jgi:transposase